MKTTLLTTPFALAVTSVVAVLCLGPPASGQPFEWQTATPASQGMSGPKLDALRDDLAGRKTRAFLVIRNDKIVCEWYAQGTAADGKQGTASLAKAIVGGLSLAVAVTDGRIRLDDPAMKYIPEWKNESKKSRITIRHLGSHTSGLSDSTTNGVKNEDQPGWKGDFWKRLPPPNDPFTIARDRAPVLFEPGRQFQYSNPGIGILTYCVTAAIKDAECRDVRSLLKERVLRPVGVADAQWSAGYGQTFTVNDLPLVGSWGGGSFTPRALACIGRLVLREGDWDGRRVLSRDAVRQVTQDAGLPGHCGMGWWTNNGRRYDWLPRDAVWGAGAGDQVLLVVPSLQMIMVRNGDALLTPGELKKLNAKDVFEQFHDPRAAILFRPLVEAVTDRPADAAPYPPSAKTTGDESAIREGRIASRVGARNMEITKSRRLIDVNIARQIARDGRAGFRATLFRRSQHVWIRRVDRAGDGAFSERRFLERRLGETDSR
jgi:CubicO group peptidase (beta-lactamase class C family)